MELCAPLVSLPDGSGVQVAERGAGHPIVFVHGWPASSNVWVNQLEGLSARYRVLALDLPGFGSSPAGSPRTLTEFARVVRDVLDTLDLAHALLIGWSMGAGVVMTYCERYGNHRLAGIGITDDCPRLLPAEDWRQGVDTTFSAAGLDDWRRRWSQDRRSVIHELTLSEFKDPARSAAQVEWLVEDSMRADPDTALAALLDAFGCDFRSGLSRVPVPALLLYGAASQMTTTANRTFMEQTLPDATLVVFAGSGHNPMLEEPERYNAAVGAFAQRIWPDQPTG